MRNSEPIASAFIEKDGKFLLVFDPGFKVWRVPGGRVEKYEKVKDTLKREMKEEIGVEIENPKFLGYGEDNQYAHNRKENTWRMIFYFHAKIDQEIKPDPDEIADHKWLSFEEIKNHENLEGALTEFFNNNPDLQL